MIKNISLILGIGALVAAPSCHQIAFQQISAQMSEQGIYDTAHGAAMGVLAEPLRKDQSLVPAYKKAIKIIDVLLSDETKDVTPSGAAAAVDAGLTPIVGGNKAKDIAQRVQTAMEYLERYRFTETLDWGRIAYEMRQCLVDAITLSDPNRDPGVPYRVVIDRLK